MIDFLVTAIGVIGLLFAVVVIFNLMIIVHEWGHFLAARWRGLQIDKFQIWFGKPIWKKTINGVQYGLGTIPMGGFVALPQMAPMEMIEGSTDSEGKKLKQITPLDKIIVAFAGPLFSFLLAIFFALIVWVVGKPVQDSSTVIAWMSPDMPAAKSGLEVGDKILKVNGNKVDRFWGMMGAVNMEVIFSEGDEIEFIVERDGKVLPPIKSGYEIAEASMLERRPFRKVGIAPVMRGFLMSTVPGGPADIAGLEKGDEITHVNGERLLNPSIINYLANDAYYSSENPEDRIMKLTVMRDEKEIEVSLTPMVPTNGKENDDGLVPANTGIISWETDNKIKRVRINPVTQVMQSTAVIARTLGGLFSPKSDVGVSHLSGFVGIGRIYYQSLLNPELGLPMVFWFSVLLNVNLALLNLLPLPVLDGGHITIATLEWIRGKPMNFKFLEYVQAGFAIMLIGFMVFVTWHDGRDLARDASKPEMPVYEKVESVPAS